MRHEAFVEYMTGERTLQEIAAFVGVPYKTIHGWHWTEGWAGIRRQFRAQLFDNWWENAAKAASADALQLLAAQLRAGMVIAERIDALAGKEDLDADEVYTLARALGESCKVMAPILERGFEGAGA